MGRCQKSASHPGLTNPLHVEVASIGTGSRTFALFFYLQKAPAAHQRRGPFRLIINTLRFGVIFFEKKVGGKF